MEPGEMIYHNIPLIKQAVDRELWIQKWTGGRSTQFLTDRYIDTLKRTPFLEWNKQDKTCTLRIGLCLFVNICAMNKYPNKTWGLLLQTNGEWIPCELCERCMILFV